MRNGTHTDAQMLYMLCLALDEGLEGINHAEDLNVLLVKMIGEHWGMSDEETPIEQVEAAFDQLAPYIPEHLKAEPQGEPSDAQVDAAIRGFHEATFGTSDNGFLTPERLENMRDPWRAALRAAGVAK